MDYSELIGVPFVSNGRTLKGLDCYGLAILVWKKNGKVLPDRLTKRSIEKIDLIELENPENLCIIEFNIKNDPYHIGVYIGNGNFIHTRIDVGVCIERLSQYQHKVKGYYKDRS